MWNLEEKNMGFLDKNICHQVVGAVCCLVTHTSP